MSSQNTSRRALGLASQDFLLPRGVDSMIALREVVQNSLDAGATQIWICPQGSGVRIMDNGKGMTAKEMSEYFRNFGAGSHQKGRDARSRMGFGAKESAWLVGEVRITSWKRNASKGNRVTLVANQDEHVIEVEVIEEGSSPDKDVIVRESNIPRQPKSFDQGTCVDFPQFAYKPEEILRFLNYRFLEINADLQVAFPTTRGNGVTFKHAMGTLQSMRMLCEYTGVEEYDNVILHWGLKSAKPTQGQLDALDNWPAPPYAIAVDNEVIESWPKNRGGLRKLATAGVSCGQENVYFLLQTKGEISFNLFRTQLEPGHGRWSEAQAIEEIEAQLPEDIENYLKAWAAKHVDDKMSDDIFSYLMEELAVALGQRTLFDDLIDGPEPPEQPDDAEDDNSDDSEDEADDSDESGGSDGSADEDEEGKEKKPRRRRPKGFPDVVFVDEGMGNEPVLLTRKCIQVNENFPSVADVFSQCGQSRPQREQAKALIKFHLITQIAQYQALFQGEFPGLEYLQAAVMNPVLANMNNHGRISLPTQRQLALFKKQKEKEG